MSLLLGGGAYAQNKNTKAKLCAKAAGGGSCTKGCVFAGHYGICGTLLYLPNSGFQAFSHFYIKSTDAYTHALEHSERQF